MQFGELFVVFFEACALHCLFYCFNFFTENLCLLSQNCFVKFEKTTYACISHLHSLYGKLWVAVNRSNFSGRKDRGRTFRSNCRDRMECGRIL